MVLTYFAVCIYSAFMAGLRARLFNVMSDRIAKNLKTEIFNKILICDTSFFDKKTNMTGALLSRINGDVEKIQEILSTNVSMTLRGSSLIIAIIVQMFFLSPKLAAITLASCSISVVGYGGIGVTMKKFMRRISAQTAVMTSDAQESFTNVKTVKAFAAEETEIAKFQVQNEILY